MLSLYEIEFDIVTGMEYIGYLETARIKSYNGKSAVSCDQRCGAQENIPLALEGIY